MSHREFSFLFSLFLYFLLLSVDFEFWPYRFCSLTDRNIQCDEARHGRDGSIWKKAWAKEKSLQLWKSSGEVPYSLNLLVLPLLEKKSLKTPFITSRLLAANPTLSEQSAHILLERGLVQVEGGSSLSPLLLSQRNNLTLLCLLCWQLNVFLSCRICVLQRRAC